jgi:hypothetical protein
MTAMMLLLLTMTASDSLVYYFMAHKS